MERKKEQMSKNLNERRKLSGVENIREKERLWDEVYRILYEVQTRYGKIDRACEVLRARW